MAVSEGERKAYKEGQEDAEKNIVDGVVSKGCDLINAILGDSRSESEEAAYQKGVSGEQLDGDKK